MNDRVNRKPTCALSDSLTDADRNDFSADVLYHNKELVIRELCTRGARIREFGSFLHVHMPEGIFCVFESESTYTSRMGARLLTNKHIAKSVMHAAGLSVPRGKLFTAEEENSARALVAELGSAVVKPVDGHSGLGVSVNVRPETFDRAWASVLPHVRTGIVVESFFANASEARYYVVDGSCIAVLFKIPPSVIGDGVRTVRKLVDDKNALRGRLNPIKDSKQVLIDAFRETIIESQGYRTHSIPPRGEKVFIDWKASLGMGGDAYDITDRAHPSLLRVAEHVSEAIPGLDVYGVDILARDHTAAATPDNYTIIEANTRPSPRNHLFPDFGPRRDVVRVMADSWLDKLRAQGASSPHNLRTASRVDVEPRQDAAEFTLVFGGDLNMADDPTGTVTDQAGASPAPDTSLRSLIANRDHLFLNLDTGPGNLSGTKEEHAEQDTNQHSPALELLKSLGADSVSLANIEASSQGGGPLLAGADKLRAAGIGAYGIGRNLGEAASTANLQTPLGTIRVICACATQSSKHDQRRLYAGPDSAGINAFQRGPGNALEDQVRRLRSEHPREPIVVFAHWGRISNNKWANSRTRETCDALLEAGADLVLGHGTRIAQEISCTDHGTAVFSLGNFLYHAPLQLTENPVHPYSLVTRLSFTQADGGISALLRLYPVVTVEKNALLVTRPVDEAEAVTFFSRMARRCGAEFQSNFALAMDNYGWHFELLGPLSKRLASASDVAIKRL